MSVWSIVVAAGSGSRFGARKQYERLGERRVIDWSLAAARSVSDGVVLVVPADAAGRREPGVDAIVAGAALRSGSVRAGLAAVPPEAEIIVVHDGARPLASGDLFAAVVDAVRSGADGAIAAVSASSTIKRVRGVDVVATLDRTELVEVQTPQAFRASALRRAHSPEGADPPDATDDAALVEAAGGRVVVVPGESTNVKVTHPADLAVARALLSERGPR